MLVILFMRICLNDFGYHKRTSANQYQVVGRCLLFSSPEGLCYRCVYISLQAICLGLRGQVFRGQTSRDVCFAEVIPRIFRKHL
jgi:hypothetical protein